MYLAFSILTEHKHSQRFQSWRLWGWEFKYVLVVVRVKQLSKDNMVLYKKEPSARRDIVLSNISIAPGGGEGVCFEKAEGKFCMWSVEPYDIKT